MESFLVWLLEGKSFEFPALSIAVFAVAVGIGKVGVKIRTEGQQAYETESVVRYVKGTARCNGRLVGWFNPLAADVAFLSTVYIPRLHENDKGHTDDFKFTGFEVDDQNWQIGHLPGPVADEVANNSTNIGIVHSKGCPALRYAAAGMYMEVGDEIAIATDDLEVAYDMVSGQGSGMIIA